MFEVGAARKCDAALRSVARWPSLRGGSCGVRRADPRRRSAGALHHRKPSVARLAAMDELSIRARVQSNWSAARGRRSSSRCSSSIPDVRCLPVPQMMPGGDADQRTVSSGRISDWMPVRSTNRMSVSAAGSDSAGLPPRGRGGTSGGSGTIIDHGAWKSEEMPLLPVNRPHGQYKGFEGSSNSSQVL